MPATQKDAKNNLTTYQYDGHDRKVKALYPDKVTAGVSSATDYEQYGFDANGNVVSLRKRNGQSLTLAYDNLNRLITRSYPTDADNVTFAYDLLNRKTAANYANGSYGIAYAWDNGGRLTNTTAGGKTVAYQYDAAGNRIRTTWPETSFYVTAAFDALNRPTAIKELGTTNLATYAYDDLSRRSTVTLGNGTTTTYGYGTQGALNSLAHNLTGTAQDITTTYTRNQARDIVTHAWNNDLYQWGATNTSKAYTANGLNQYATVAGATLAYDGNGNLTGDGVWTYGYDLDNRLKTATKTGYSASLAYDGAGRLRQTTLGGVVTNLLYDGEDLIAEYDGANAVLRRYVHGPGIDEPLVWYEGATTTNKTWLYADHQGSIVGQANAAGTSTAIYSYGPFGEPNVTTGSRFRYTGQQYLSQIGLYYYKARFYSPTLGRFLQTDPIGYQDDNNLYAYVGNGPINRRDPLGLNGQEAILLACTMCDGVLNGLADWWNSSAAAARNESFSDGMMKVLQGLNPEVGAGVAAGIGAIKNIRVESAVATELPNVIKAVNSNLGHAVDRAIERGILDVNKAADALRALSTEIGKTGWPIGSILDTANADRVLVPIGNAGMAVYQVGANGTAKLKTVLNSIIN